MSNDQMFDPDVNDLPNYAFDGDTADPIDFSEFSRQLRAVYDIMSDHQWHSIATLANMIGCSQQSASARLRDLRKTKFGAFVIERERITKYNGSVGAFMYRLVGIKGDGTPQRKACNGCDERDREIARLQALLQSRVA